MANPILVPVVAHRMYGTRFVAVPRSGPARRENRFLPHRPPLPGLPAGGFEFARVVDPEHGTRRSTEEIRRLFHEGPEPDYARNWSVNRLWRSTDIQFLLVGVIDQRIESHLADMVPRDSRFRPDFVAFNVAEALNMYFVRDIVGARGYAGHEHSVMGDRWDPVRPDSGRTQAWADDVITVSHELGHMMDLSHRDDVDNLMYGWGTRQTSKELTVNQAVFSQLRARAYRRPWYRNIPPDHDLQTADVDVPHVRGHAGELLPSFD